jgi:hypothetical protein
MFPSFGLISRFFCLSSLAQNNRKIPSKIRKTYLVSTPSRACFHGKNGLTAARFLCQAKKCVTAWRKPAPNFGRLA